MLSIRYIVAAIELSCQQMPPTGATIGLSYRKMPPTRLDMVYRCHYEAGVSLEDAYKATDADQKSGIRSTGDIIDLLCQEMHSKRQGNV